MLALGDFGKLRRYALWEAKWLQIASAGIAWDRACRSPNMAGRTNFVFQDSTIQR